MIQASLDILEQLKEVLQLLPKHSFSEPCSTLSNATIAQHTRHVIELYECLISGYKNNNVCYDNRKRDQQLEQSVDYAISKINWIQEQLDKPNKDLTLYITQGGESFEIDTNYHREVFYNFEHVIHHEALIKVGIKEITNLNVPESFGVAPSTMAYKKQCVQ